ncbi:MAG: DUF5671 domain-containing protein [Patescibacteria group bacterium]
MPDSKNLPRDVFLYILSTVLLAFVSIHVGMLTFQLVNIGIPDPFLDGAWSGDVTRSLMRWAIAVLVITFPALLWTLRFLRKDVAAFPEKRDMRVRRWLLYFTLFVAGIVAIGDLVTVLHAYLQGDLSLRFLLKAFSVLAIAGVIMSVYRSELSGVRTGVNRAVEAGATGFVVAALVAGLVIAGTPQSQRLVRLDDRRINDLSSIQWQIIQHWQAKNVLPANLDVLTNELSGFYVPTDPVTKAAYEYRATGARSFELCATFETDTVGSQQSLAYPMEKNESWEHGAERTCFERTIDPDLYPPLKTR